MNKLSLLVVGILASFVANAQQAKKVKTDNSVVHAQEVPVTYHGVTATKLIDYVEPAGTVNEIVKTYKVGYHPKNDWQMNPIVNPNALPQGPDPALQKHYPPPAPPTKALVANWDGISNFNVSPADPAVDVGPNHVVQMTNGPSGAYIQVYSKTGTPIGGQVYFDNFMSMPGGLGDPIVLYDERADRWFLSEFSSAGNNLHVAISTTPDPTGTYNTYSFNSTGGFPDYPKYSIWENEYVMTANVGTPDIWVLNRADMLAGTPTTAQKFSQSNYNTIGFQASTPVSMLGTAVPPAGAPAMVMRMRDDAWAGVSTDALEIWNLDIDWATPANSTFSLGVTLPMSLPFDSELCGFTSFSCIDQPNSNTNLDPLREVLMNRIMYRNFGTHESMVCTHVTDVSGSDDAGIRWYELRRTGGAGGAWTIYQESTYSPDNDSRWMPTIGLSASGNIGLAYNVSSATTFPSLRYTGRQECDPLNQMTEPETVIAAGTTNNSSNRYGDYNSMGVDPSDGETFYMTGMYNPVTAGRTHIGAFDIAVCAQNPEVMFDNSAYTVNEPDASVAASACLDYVIIDVPISIGVAPSQNADITITVTGGSATQGVDYTLNNTSFTLNGGNLTETVQVWVYNDNVVEGTETIQLGYTLNANGGDAYAGPTNQLVDIDILDDDLDPTSMPGGVAVIFTEDFETGWGGVTTLNPSGDTPFQIGNNGTVPNGAYTIPATNTTEFAWIDDDDCNCDQDNVDLILPSADLTNYLTATLTFDSYFEDNTYQSINEDADLMVSVGGGPDQLIGALVSSGIDGPWVAQSFDVSAYVGNSNVVFKLNYSDNTGWLYGLAVDNFVLSGSGPIGVQTAVNTGAGMEANLGPNQTVHFYDPGTNDVMMTLQNTSAFDYGCVTVDVDRAGTGALQFNTATTADFLHSKTFTVTPTNTNPSGTYNITVYYEEAEVAGWEAATGNSRNNADIVKVAGNNAINDVNPGNAATFNISSSGSTVGAFFGDVTFTGAFSTGFSGFGVGVYNPGAPTGPTANFTSSATTICAGSSVTFTDLSGGTPTSWAWDFGDGGTSTQQNPVYVYNTPGTYTVTLTATNAQGSDVQALTSYITVTNGVTYAQTVDLCPGQSVTVGTSTYTSAGTYTDVLSSGGCDSTVTTTVNMLSASSSTQNVEICQGSSYTVGGSTYTSPGTYTDVITNTAGCDSTVTTNLTVNPLPTVDITPASIAPLCSYESAIGLTGSPAGGTFAGNGVSGSSFDPATAGAGTHVITYSYTDANNCTNSINLSVTVMDCSGVPEETLEGVTLHPNPSNGQFTISGLEVGTSYQIFDERGRLVIDAIVSAENEQVLMPVVNNGIYYLRAKKDGVEGGIKFLIAR